MPTPANASGTEQQNRKLTSWRAIADHVIKKMNGPEVVPEPPYNLAQWMPADPSEAERAVRGHQAKQLQGTVKQWQLQAGVPKAKAALQALTWCGKFKRAAPEKFTAEGAGLLCSMLDRLATTHADDRPEAIVALSQRVVTLLDAMIADPAVRERCLCVAADDMRAGGAQAESMLGKMEAAAREFTA